MSQADFSRFLRNLGSQYRFRIRGEDFSLKKRLNDFIDLMDEDPQLRTDDGELVADLVVERAASDLPDLHPWSGDEWPAFAALRRTLHMDGYNMVNGALRRSLPNDLHLPEVEDEVRVLLRRHGLETALGHLDQALDAHAQGNWSSANGQLRNLLDAVLDGIAEKIDPSAAGLPSGQPRRGKLAAAGFLSRDLNEWSDDGRGFLNGLIARLHPHGAHPGLSSDEDSTFRLHTVLVTVRLLLVRYDRGPV